MPGHSLPSGDKVLVQIVDAALADSARRSGKWLACKAGCSQCCIGVFAINPLDAMRLQKGLAELEAHDPERAARVRTRALDTVARLSPEYPGDPVTGWLEKDNSDEACKRWDDFANAEPCPVLDPGTGMCDLYAWRPITCRTFGPPLMAETGLGVCELCFDGASEEEVAACEMHPDPHKLEEALLKEMNNTVDTSPETIIAFALVP